MVGDWRQASIGALCDAGIAELQTGPFGTQLHAYDYVDDGVPVVPTEAIRGRQIDHSVLPRITQTKAQELERHRLRPGDILFARRGVQATGHIGCVRTAEDGFICGTGAIRLRVTRPGDGIDSDYLSHVLADPSSIEWFKFHAIGATMPNLNEGIIRSFPLYVPPLPEQRAIGYILGTLDDKIDLNRRMCETLEAMAQTLFRSWFVDFDSVHPETAAGCRPSRERLDHSPAGPKSEADRYAWPVGRFACIAEQLREQEAPFEHPDTLFRHFSIPAFDEGRAPKLELGASIKSAKWHVPTGSILLSKLNPEIERVWLVDVAPGERAVCSTEFVVLRPRKAFGAPFVYCLATSPLFRQQLEALVTGTSKSHQRAHVDAILDLPVIVPPEPVASAFDEAMSPILERALSARRESRTLADLRDTLLPKLVSGEIRVKEAERFLQDAAS